MGVGMCVFRLFKSMIAGVCAGFMQASALRCAVRGVVFRFG